MDLDSLLSQGYAALAAGGRLAEATDLFRRAVDLAPDHPRALLGRRRRRDDHRPFRARP